MKNLIKLKIRADGCHRRIMLAPIHGPPAPLKASSQSRYFAFANVCAGHIQRVCVCIYVRRENSIFHIGIECIEQFEWEQWRYEASEWAMSGGGEVGCELRYVLIARKAILFPKFLWLCSMVKWDFCSKQHNANFHGIHSMRNRCMCFLIPFYSF